MGKQFGLRVGGVSAIAVALALLALRPLLTPVPPNGLWSVTGRFIRRHPLRFLLVNLTWRGRYMVNQPRLAKDYLFSDSMSDADVQRYLAQIDDESYCAYLDGLFRSAPQKPPAPLDVLVVGAQHDRLIGAKDNRRTAAFFGAELVEVADIAHDVMLEPRWRVVAELIRARLPR